MSIQESLFTEIAEAIRQKGGTSATIAAKDFAKAILALPTSSSPIDPDNPDVPSTPDVPDCTIQVISRNLSSLSYKVLTLTPLIDNTNFIIQSKPLLSIVGLVMVPIVGTQVGEFIHKEADEI